LNSVKEFCLRILYFSVEVFSQVFIYDTI
jgi:hypothetical protein